jgi:ketosteroid isomerase-like protein
MVDSRADEAQTEVLAAARAIIAAFAGGRVDEYFSRFHPAASFVFSETPVVLGSRDEYRAEWRRWVEDDGFEVLAGDSSEQRAGVFGDTGVFTHTIVSRIRTHAGVDESRERETIVFARQADGKWVAVHEHLSPAPQAADEPERTAAV